MTAGCSEPVTVDPAKTAPDLLTRIQGLSNDSTPLEVIVQRQSHGPFSCPNVGLFDATENGTKGLMEALGGELHGTFTKLHGFFGVLPAGSLAELSNCEGITHISPNRATLGAEVSQGQVEALVQRTSGAAEVNGQYTGAGVTVAVLDSGVKTNHRALTRADPEWVVGERAFLRGRERLKRRRLKDKYGHGTLVAGAIMSQVPGAPGVAPGANLLSLKVLNGQGQGRVSDAIMALDWLAEHGPARGVGVVNISIASPPGESYTSDPLGQAVARVIEEGMIVVASAGNFGSSAGESFYGGIGSPANHPWVITVGASDSMGTTLRGDDRVASFSSRGPTLFDGISKPDLIAPGVALPLPSPCGSRLKQRQVFTPIHDSLFRGRGCWLKASGTSFAAPLVAGAVALMLEANPDLTPTQVKAILQLTAESFDDTHPLSQGAGQLNITGAVELAAIWRADASPGEDLLTETIPENPSSQIDGEEVLWSNGIIWNGYVAWNHIWQSQDLDVAYWGSIEGTGIIWNGRAAEENGLAWLDYRVNGLDLIRRFQGAYSPDVMWGDGIIWNGRLTYNESASFGAEARWMWSERLLDPASWPSAPAIFGSADSPDNLEHLKNDQEWIQIPTFQ